jgi:hypothetical protein
VDGENGVYRSFMGYTRGAMYNKGRIRQVKRVLGSKNCPISRYLVTSYFDHSCRVSYQPSWSSCFRVISKMKICAHKINIDTNNVNISTTLLLLKKKTVTHYKLYNEEIHYSCHPPSCFCRLSRLFCPCCLKFT